MSVTDTQYTAWFWVLSHAYWLIWGWELHNRDVKMESRQELSGSPAPQPGLQLQSCIQGGALRPDTSVPSIGIRSGLAHRSAQNSKPGFRRGA